MDALTATVREALIAEGASPATANDLEADFVEWLAKARNRIARDHKFNEAQRLLPLIGAVKAAEQLGVCKATIYYRTARKSKKFDTVRQNRNSVGQTK